jgi:5-methylcytosine-specific restriction protein A
MSNWASSKRRKDPAGWSAIRAFVIEQAGGRCQEFLTTPDPATSTTLTAPCNYPGRDVDHLIPLSRGGTDDIENLRLLCTWHHKQKTQREAASARKPISERRPKSKHPGLN